MKKLFSTFALLMCVSLAFAQKMFKSTDEIGTKPYIPSMEFKQKVAKLSNRVVGTELGEFPGIYDKDFYQLKNGFISLYQDNEYAHFRMIFDEKQNWIETQEFYHSDVVQEDDYYKFMPKMKQQIEQRKYKIEEFTPYIKCTNEKGFWYEIKARRKNDTQIFVLDKDLKFVKRKKAIY